jgi:hypothetical protein
MLRNADKQPDDSESATTTQLDMDPSLATTAVIETRLIDPSPELARPLAELAQMINYLGDNLPRHLATAVLRAVAVSIDEWLWLRVVRTHQFGDAGARQLVVDVERGLAGVGRNVIRRPERHYRR